MLRRLSELHGYTIRAVDSDIGQVSEIYFDDKFWMIRYLEVDTAVWLPGRRVLISPAALAQPCWTTHTLCVRLTKKQVAESPLVTSEQPVDRQVEDELHRYYGWPRYWADRPLSPSPYFLKTNEIDEPNLCSSQEVVGYQLQAIDDKIGQVKDFIVQDRGWVIRYVIIDGCQKLLGKKVLIPTDWIEGINWIEQQVQANVKRNNVAQRSEFETEMSGNNVYEQGL